MQQLTKRPIAVTGGAPVVICPVRNEIKFLPHFLKHYRSLGVKEFIFIDNGSTDGSTEMLLQQPDAYVMYTEQSFKDANYGMSWVNSIIRDHCLSKWVLFVDCDEFLIFPESESRDLKSFCAYLSTKGFNCAPAAMIDMYPEGNFLDLHLHDTDDIFVKMPYFDSHYYFRQWPRRAWDPKQQSFNLQILGGPRMRLLSSMEKEIKRGAYYYTLCNQVDRFINYVPEYFIPLIASVWPIELPALQKRPLNFIGNDFLYFDNHSNNNNKLSDQFSALLHFKLCEELKKRVEQKSLLLSHYRRGLSYEQIRLAISRWNSESLVYHGSLKYINSNSLSAVGLIGPEVPKLWSAKEVSSVITPVPHAE